MQNYQSHREETQCPNNKFRNLEYTNWSDCVQRTELSSYRNKISPNPPFDIPKHVIKLTWLWSWKVWDCLGLQSHFCTYLQTLSKVHFNSLLFLLLQISYYLQISFFGEGLSASYILLKTKIQHYFRTFIMTDFERHIRSQVKMSFSSQQWSYMIKRWK